MALSSSSFPMPEKTSRNSLSTTPPLFPDDAIIHFVALIGYIPTVLVLGGMPVFMIGDLFVAHTLVVFVMFCVPSARACNFPSSLIEGLHSLIDSWRCAIVFGRGMWWSGGSGSFLWHAVCEFS